MDCNLLIMEPAGSSISVNKGAKEIAVGPGINEIQFLKALMSKNRQRVCLVCYLDIH